MKGDPLGNFFFENSHNAEKNWKGGPFGFFSIYAVAKHQKKLKGDPLAKNKFEIKSQWRKKLKGGPFSLSQYCMLRGKRGKTFLIQFARPNDLIWDNKVS